MGHILNITAGQQWYLIHWKNMKRAKHIVKMQSGKIFPTETTVQKMGKHWLKEFEYRSQM